MQELSEQFSQIINQINQGFFDVVSVAQIIGYALTVFFIFAIIYSIISLVNVKDLMEESFDNHFLVHRKPRTIKPHMERWKKVTDAVTSDNEQLWRVAIIEADTMLEEVVTALGFLGDTFGEQLKSINRSQVSWIDAAWEVHRLRNVIAHEGGRYHLTQREAYRAYKIYESILYSEGYLS